MSTLVKKKHRKGSSVLQKIWKTKFWSKILVDFYSGAIESNITNWHGSFTAQDQKALQQVIKTTQSIIATHLQSISDTGEVRGLRRAHRILKDVTHPGHSLSCCHLAKDTEVSAAIHTTLSTKIYIAELTLFCFLKPLFKNDKTNCPCALNSKGGYDTKTYTNMIIKMVFFFPRHRRRAENRATGSAARTQVFPFIIMKVIHLGCGGACRMGLQNKVQPAAVKKVKSTQLPGRNTARGHIAVANHISWPSNLLHELLKPYRTET